jgi:hypothetical protein
MSLNTRTSKWKAWYTGLHPDLSWMVMFILHITLKVVQNIPFGSVPSAFEIDKMSSRFIPIGLRLGERIEHALLRSSTYLALKASR